jgi:hypothetical protein
MFGPRRRRRRDGEAVESSASDPTRVATRPGLSRDRAQATGLNRAPKRRTNPVALREADARPGLVAAFREADADPGRVLAAGASESVRRASHGGPGHVAGGCVRRPAPSQALDTTGKAPWPRGSRCFGSWDQRLVTSRAASYFAMMLVTCVEPAGLVSNAARQRSSPSKNTFWNASP